MRYCKGPYFCARVSVGSGRFVESSRDRLISLMKKMLAKIDERGKNNDNICLCLTCAQRKQCTNKVNAFSLQIRLFRCTQQSKASGASGSKSISAMAPRFLMSSFRKAFEKAHALHVNPCHSISPWPPSCPLSRPSRPGTAKLPFLSTRPKDPGENS